MMVLPNGGSYEHCWAMVDLLRGEVPNGMGFCVVFRRRRLNVFRLYKLREKGKDQVSEGV